MNLKTLRMLIMTSRVLVSVCKVNKCTIHEYFMFNFVIKGVPFLFFFILRPLMALGSIVIAL